MKKNVFLFGIEGVLCQEWGDKHLITCMPICFHEWPFQLLIMQEVNTGTELGWLRWFGVHFLVHEHIVYWWDCLNLISLCLAD